MWPYIGHTILKQIFSKTQEVIQILKKCIIFENFVLFNSSYRLCALFQVKYVFHKFRECDPYMGHRRWWRIYHFHPVPKIFYTHYFCGHMCPTVPFPPDCRKLCCQTFCNAISSTDMAETIWWYIQSPHDQVALTIPVSALYAYPEPSNRCWKAQNRFVRRSTAPATSRNLSDNFVRL